MIKPRYIAIAAVTLDGKIAKNSNHNSSWTSKEDKIFMHSFLDKCDCIIVGNNTYKTAIKPLSKRNCIVLSKTVEPSPLVRGDVAQRATERLLYINPQKTNLKKLIRTLKYKKIAILGGAQTYTYCLQNNLLDELYLTIEPIVFGSGINLFSVPPSPLARGDVALATERSKLLKFKLLSIKKLNKQGSLLLHYKK